MAAKLDAGKALKHLGDCSRWKLLIFFALSIFSGIAVCWQILGIVFIGLNPPHHCKLPEGKTPNISIPLILNGGHITQDRCHVWRNFSIETNESVPCPDGWDYSGKIRDTIVDEWNLVCDKGYISSTSQTLLMAGSAIGAFILSIFSDKFGRKKVIIISGLVISIVGFITAWAPDVYAFLVLRLLAGFFQQGLNLGSNVYVCEFFQPSKRVMMSELSGSAFSLGIMLIALIAWIFPNWHHFTMVISSPGLLAIPMICLLPESVTWLVAKGRIKEAKQVLVAAAKMNKVTLPPEFQLSEDVTDQESGSSRNIQPSVAEIPLIEIHRRESPVKDDKSSNYSMIELIKSCRLLIITIILVYIWFVNGLVYYGISLNASALYGDLYINFMLMGLVDIPGAIISIYMYNKLGRRWTLFIFHLITGLALGVIVFIPPVTANGMNLKPLIVTLVMIAKLGIGSTFGGLYVYTPEVYPTTLRNFGIGFASIGGRIGCLIAPFTPYIAEHLEWLPNVVFGSLAIIGAFLALICPETRGRPLPRTVEEVEGW